MKDTMSELQNTVEGIKNRLDEAEDWITKLEDKVEKNTPKEQEKENRKNEEELRELQGNMKCNKIHIIGIPEEEEWGIENLFEKVMMENFPILMREKVTQIQESQRVPTKKNPNRPTSRHIIIKMEGEIRSFPDKRSLKEYTPPNQFFKRC